MPYKNANTTKIYINKNILIKPTNTNNISAPLNRNKVGLTLLCLHLFLPNQNLKIKEVHICIYYTFISLPYSLIVVPSYNKNKVDNPPYFVTLNIHTK